MTTPIAPNMRKPLGRALSRNDLELDRLSIVTGADVLAAVDLFHATAPREFRRLIDARPTPPNDTEAR